MGEKEFISSFTLDHIGIAVNSLDEGKAPYEALGFKKMSVEDVPAEGVRVGMYELKNNARIELLEPLNENSPIAKFLEKKGPGIHHICLSVPDIADAIKKAKALNMTIINDPPNKGAHNCLVSFVHPKSMGGVLVELSQKMTGQKMGAHK